MKLSEVWTLYDSDKRMAGYSPVTLKSYDLQCRLLIRYFGDVDVESLTYEKLKEYVIKDSDRLKVASIEHRMKFLKSLFRYSTDDGLVDKNPTAKMRFPKQGHRIPKSLTEETIEYLREACETPLEHALIELFYTTGCRIGEVYRLNRKDIDWEERTMIVLGKGDKEREVYFTIKCRIWLKKYLESRNDDDPALIVTRKAPHRMSIPTIRHLVKKIAERSDSDINVYPHKLRHSYATHLLDNGAPMEFIQEAMGHAKIDTTRLYAMLSGEKRKEMYRKYF